MMENGKEKPVKKNPARHERLHKDWPIKVQVYDARPIGDIPEAVWDTAHAMRRLWNEFTALFRKTAEADRKDEQGKPLLSKDERRDLWSGLDVKSLREIAKGYGTSLDSYCREAVVVDFTRTVGQWRKSPARWGQPRFQSAHEMSKVRIPITFNAGVSAAKLSDGSAGIYIRYTLPFKQEAPELYLQNGRFPVGINRVPLDLHVSYGGRSGKNKYFLPEDCRIKQVSLCGRRDSAFGWSWSLQFRLEHPPRPDRAKTGRVCGWDSGGWRLVGDYIRIGVIADNAGHFYEVMVPLSPRALNRQQRREKFHCEKHGWTYDKPETWADLIELDRKYGGILEQCKTNLRRIYEAEKEQWPESARKIMSGIVKMREAGLRALLRELTKAEMENHDAVAIIGTWCMKAAILSCAIRAFEIKVANAKRDAFKQIAAWMDGFDLIAWESDLSLKRMAEESGKQKERRKKLHSETGEWTERTPEERQFEAAQKYRQIAGQYELRAWVAQKHKARLQNEPARYSTQTCPECDGHIEPGRKLLLTCENGHIRDQDVAASLYFLNKIEGHASITAPPLEIPAHLRGYLRVMSANEVAMRHGAER